MDIAVPVLNEEKALSGCVRTLHAFLGASFPLPWRITITDNGSTDGTWELAEALAAELPGVYARRLDVRGKGAAVKAAWRDSPAAIVAYMDVDLSTGLEALLPLIAPLVSGHSELAIGTRLANGSRIRRGPRRELVSRCYNTVLRFGFGVRFTDAACGFKAARADVIRPLLDRVRDDAWFFDTELLLLAEHNGLRIHEVPVDWIEDTDSKVDIARTTLNDLSGLVRVARTMYRGHATALVPRPREPEPWHPDAAPARPARQVRIGSFAAIGLLSTCAHVGLYVLTRTDLTPLLANLVALVLTGVANTEANRRWTFNRPGRRLRQHARAGVLFTLTFALTSTAVIAAPTRGVEIAGLVAASGAATLLRFAALDRWVFRRN